MREHSGEAVHTTTCPRARGRRRQEMSRTEFLNTRCCIETQRTMVERVERVRLRSLACQERFSELNPARFVYGDCAHLWSSPREWRVDVEHAKPSPRVFVGFRVMIYRMQAKRLCGRATTRLRTIARAVDPAARIPVRRNAGRLAVRDYPTLGRPQRSGRERERREAPCGGDPLSPERRQDSMGPRHGPEPAVLRRARDRTPQHKTPRAPRLEMTPPARRVMWCRRVLYTCSERVVHTFRTSCLCIIFFSHRPYGSVDNLPERSKGSDSSSDVFALAGSNPAVVRRNS